jgi:hypothetical protein
VVFAGCNAVSPSTRERTTRIVDVMQDVAPRYILVGREDEVRWRNRSSQPVVISFPPSTANRISCNSGFKMGADRALSALIEPESAAALCFMAQGKYNYEVRLDRNLGSVLTDKRASVWVVGRGERNPDPYEEYTNVTP